MLINISLSTTAPSTMKAEDDKGGIHTINIAKEAKAYKSSRLTKKALWDELESDFAYLRQSPKTKSARSRSDVKQAILNAILDVRKAAKKPAATKKVQKPKHLHEFNNDEQEDAFFGVFDTKRGKQFTDEEEETLGAEIQQKGKLLHRIVTSGGNYDIFQYKGKLYGVLESGEGVNTERLKTADLAVLDKVIARANKAADSVVGDGDFDDFHYCD